MLLAAILALLLIGNWFLTETLVLIPVDLVTRLSSYGLWGLGLVVVSFLAWCISDD